MLQIRRPKVDTGRGDLELQTVNTCPLRHNSSPSLSDIGQDEDTERNKQKAFCDVETVLASDFIGHSGRVFALTSCLV